MKNYNICSVVLWYSVSTQIQRATYSSAVIISTVKPIAIATIHCYAKPWGGGQICVSMLQARINKMHEIGLDILKILWFKTCGKAQQANPYVDNSFLPIHKYYLFFNKVWICTPIFFYCRWLQIKCQRPKENCRTQKKKTQVCIVIAW